MVRTLKKNLRLPADCNGRRSSDIPKRYAGARDNTFARSEIIGFLSVTDTHNIPRCDTTSTHGNNNKCWLPTLTVNSTGTREFEVVKTSYLCL